MSVTLNEGLESIGEYAFYYASALETLVIPKSVVSIGKRLCYYANSIKSVVLLDPDNWYITTTKDAPSGIDQKSRTDDAANATLSKDTYYWYKKAN